MAAAGKSRRKREPALKPYEAALVQLRSHYLLGPVARELDCYAATKFRRDVELPRDAYCVIEVGVNGCELVFNDALKLSEPQWLAVFALGVLVLAAGASTQLPVPSRTSDLAAQLAALHWWRELRLGELPEHFELPGELVAWGRQPLKEIASRLASEPPDEVLDGAWTLTRSATAPLLVPAPKNRWVRQRVPPLDYEALFAQALVDNAKRALQLQHEASRGAQARGDPHSPAARAWRWLVTHYPLLGSVLTQFELVEDAAVCERMHISIAAIQVGTAEIYINPRRALGLEESKFVIAHEVLHAGLNHAGRRAGRDPFLWNVACDFVINDWLVGMNLGIPPRDGLLYDEDLRGLPAEEIYLRLAADLRVRRRLATLRGDDVDMLDDARPDRRFTDRDEFCRRALAQGLDYHQASGRGLLPEGLVEAIRTLNQPAIPWQAKLAEWIQERCPLPERRRSWARPSRRQSATPDIPRPRFVEPEDERASRTFGVIVDSSGSMMRDDLGKALGAIVAYSRAQAVRQVRLVYCDAAPYDEGYVDIESLAERVRVRGRGGTVLQPAVNLLQTRTDFPKASPILIITDGLCEEDLQVARDHAFLLSPGGRLPFVTRKPVFEME